MSKYNFTANARTKFGTGAAREVRRNAQIPVALYSDGKEPSHISIEEHGFALALKTVNPTFELEIDGKKTLAIVKEVQRNVVSDVIEHVDLYEVKPGQMVPLSVRIDFKGDVRGGNELKKLVLRAPVMASVDDLPQVIEVSVDGLAAGAKVLVSDLELPSHLKVDLDANAVLAEVKEIAAKGPKKTEETEEAAAAADAS